MGRELHDSTAQILVALQLKVMYLKGMFDDPHYREMLMDVGESIHELHQEIRAVTFLSGLPPLKEGSLSNALRTMSERFGQLTGLEISFHSTGSRLRCSPAMEISLYRIAQEALANVFRHAKARTVELSLVAADDEVRLIVKDDGIGVQPCRQRAASGVGLDSIRRRVREFDGRLDFRRLKRGSRFSVIIPR